MDEHPETVTPTAGFDDPFADESESDQVLAPPMTVPNVRATNTQLRFTKYMKEFDATAGRESVVFCTLPAAVVDDGSRAQLLAAGIEKEDEAMRHKNTLLHIDELKRNRLKELEQVRTQRRAQHLKQLMNIETLRQSTNQLLRQYYDFAEQELSIHLTSRQGEVAQSIGEIRRFHRGEYDPNVPDWTLYEQQVEIRIVKIRGMKNKVPKGKYTVLISKWDKLGGEPLRWNHRDVTDKPPPPCPLHPLGTSLHVRASCEVCTGWAGATMPVEYAAAPTDYEASFDSRIFTFFLPQKRIRPYNALLFEVVHIPSDRECVRIRNTTGAEPRPQVVGWCVLPIVDSNFLVINGRFRLPVMRGSYTQNFQHYSTLQTALNENLENWLANMYLEIFPHAREHFGRNEFQLQSEFTCKLLDLGRFPSSKDPEGWPSDGRKRGCSIDATNTAIGGSEALSGGLLGITDNAGLFDDDFQYVRPAKFPEGDTPAETRWNLLRVAVKDRYLANKRKLQEQQREAIRRLEMQKQFRYSIHPFGATSFQSIWRIQVEYCMRAIMDELSLRQPLSFKFWTNVFVFVLMFWIQLYVHGIFVYVTLYNLGSPVTKVEPSSRGLLVDYNQRIQTPLIEMLIVLVSQLSTYFILLAEIALGYFFKRFAGSIPEQLSRFVFCSSFTAVLIPVFEIVMDLALGEQRSDFFRVQLFMQTHQYGDYFTYIIIFLVYVCCVVGCIVSTFLFTMALHLNGILQDSYWRIMIVNEDTCHVPEDLEVSAEELDHILDHAEKWRGKNGERRKISVEKIVTTDETDVTFEQVDLHITVHEMAVAEFEQWCSKGKPTKIYREFYVMYTGAILEATGDNRPAGISITLHQASRSQRLEGAVDALLGGVRRKGAGGGNDDGSLSREVSLGRSDSAFFGGGSYDSTDKPKRSVRF